MKSTAVTLLASLLFEILAPGFSYASRKPQAEKTDGVARPPSGYRTGNKPDAGPEALEEVAAKAIRLFYEMEVRTMSRGQLDVHRLKKGLVAHVIYTSPDGADALTGVIAGKDSDGILIKQTDGMKGKVKVSYADIDTIVVARNRRALERWQRRTLEGLVIMSQANLDMSKLKKGWHAYVVYWYKGERRAELTKILKSDPGHLVIRSNYKARDKFRAEGIIPRGNIVVIVAAEKRGDITGWKNANRVIQHLSENARIRFKSPRIASGESKAAWIVGRLFAVNQDTFVVEVGRSGSDIYHVPLSSFADLEVSIGRSGNSLKGLLAGGFIGSTLSGAIAALTGKPDPTSEIPTFGDMAMIVVCFTAIIVPAVIGMNTTTERWADVPLSGLNLSVAPTQERGLRTELSFDI